MTNKVLLSICLLIFVFCQAVSATTYDADNASFTAVSTAIDLASDGDTVTIPTGTATWGSAITIPTGVTLQGAGVGNTVISTSSHIVLVNMSDNSRLTAVEFGDAGVLNTNTVGWRLDHCKFTAVGTNRTGIRTFWTTKDMWGLIDNNEFVNFTILISSVDIYNDARWFQTLSLGDSATVYIEDNTFSNDTLPPQVVDANHSGMYVFRYNTVNDGYFEAHGGSDSRGTRRWEIYRNTINNDFDNFAYSQTMNIRGGTGVIFDNISSGTQGEASNAWSFADGRYTGGQGGTYSGFCDGTSDWDTKPHPATDDSLLCSDSIGAGPDTILGPSTLLVDHPELPHYDQYSVPAYLWGNTRDSGYFNFRVAATAVALIVEDRDFYVDGSLSGTISGGGVSSDVLASIPASCTVGQGYWATDQGNWNKTPGANQGVLYKCTSTDTWTEYYTPYTYPHPLSVDDGLIKVSHINSGGLTISNIGSGNLTISNMD